MDLSAYRNLVDFKNICRTCMNNQNLRHKIRDENIKVDNNNTSVLELLNVIYEVKLHKGFPDEICSTCLEQLRSFYKFKLQIEKSESVLKKHLGPFDENHTAINSFAQHKIGLNTLSFTKQHSSHITNTVFVKNDFSNFVLSKYNEADIDLGPLKISDEKDDNVETIDNKKPETEKRKDFTGRVFSDCEENSLQENDPSVEINPAVCTICNKTFKSKYILNVHLKRHKFKGQYLCTLCGKGFNSQGCLNRHARVHTGEKNYQCETCQKRFPSSNNLNIHLRTHTGVKPYLCNLCGKSFTNRTGRMYVFICI